MEHLAALRDLSATYAQLLRFEGLFCQEPCDIGNEYALQALWYKQAFEGVALTLTDGRSLEVIEPGRWNHADGPDFFDAILMIGGELCRGNVECHVTPSHWDTHHHTSDPAYGGLVLHVTWFATPPAKTLPTRIPHLALKPLLPLYPSELQIFRDEDRIDGIAHPCRDYFRNHPLALDKLLTAAGYYRLLTKTHRFVESLQAENATQIFYENLMAAMGYSRNAETFKRLAKEVSLSMLEPFPTKTRFAVLSRVAGLLKETQRDLWDLWWSTGFQPPLQPYIWNYKGLRPQNHPFKRLAGGLGILHHLSTLLDTPLMDLPKAIVKAADFLRKDIGASAALVGTKRAVSVTLNLFVPYRLALGSLSERDLTALPGEDISMPMRDTWLRLTGETDHLPTDGLRQQGLLQIYADFCHNPRFLCKTCPIGSQH